MTANPTSSAVLQPAPCGPGVLEVRNEAPRYWEHEESSEGAEDWGADGISVAATTPPLTKF